MKTEEDKLRDEREATDESLRAERAKTDQVARAARDRVQHETDERVGRLREHADAVVEGAREKTDHAAKVEGDAAQVLDAVGAERAVEDSVIRRERAAIDDLQRERAEELRAVVALLPLERQKTDRKLLTERARSDEVVEQRDDFLAMVTHDLRNMLGGIAMQGMLLSEQATDSDEGRRVVAAMKQIQRYVARMNRLVGDLVDVASIEAGQFAVLPESGDANALLSEVIGVFAATAQEKGVTLERGALGIPLIAEFDHDRMFQVLANVITNAIKFTPKGGSVCARVERTNGELQIAVRDTGAGIPPDLLEAVFERFWQTGQGDRRGLGLGLYISRCIVAAHGGKIWAESSPGEGSEFHIAIPATAAASCLPDDAPALTPPSAA